MSENPEKNQIKLINLDLLNSSRDIGVSNNCYLLFSG